MFLSKNHEQTILEIVQGDFIAIAAESFLIDRQASELDPKTPKFYRQFLTPFLKYCDENSFKLIGDITPDFLRRYFLLIAETHNPGGVHAAFRTLRSFSVGCCKKRSWIHVGKTRCSRSKLPKFIVIQ